MSLEQRDTRETDCSKDAVARQIAAKRAGWRKNIFHGGTLCSKCLAAPPRHGQRYCLPCHNTSALASYHRKQAELKAPRASKHASDHTAHIRVIAGRNGDSA